VAQVAQILSLLQEYRLVEETFRGPATVAWRAEHIASGLPARITIVSPPPRASREATDAICVAFRRALEQAGAFSGPDILPFDGTAEHDGMPCAITMLPTGTLLSDAMAVDEPVSVARVMQIGSVVGHALARLHDAGLWHGYLHPANILLVEDERPALLDYVIHAAAAEAAWRAGLAVTGSTYIGVGERAFRDPDPATDVYALATILLQIMTGRSPERMLMEQIEQRLPQALPASLRQDLVAALNIGGHSRPPTARTLAVHLSFDVAWLRATAELAPPKGASPDAPAAHREGASESASTPWTHGRTDAEGTARRAYEPVRPLPAAPAPGVGDAPPEAPSSTTISTAATGRAARPTPVNSAVVRHPSPPPRDESDWPELPHIDTMGAADREPLPRATWPLVAAGVALLLAVSIPIGYRLGSGRGHSKTAGTPATTPVQARSAGARQALTYDVLLGPYPDRASAVVVQKATSGAWPEVWIMLENGQAFVHVLNTVYSEKAQRAVDRLQQQGYQAQIRQSTRNYSP
jgi:serine/threonine protein kinase